jgi:hypothetical protein
MPKYRVLKDVESSKGGKFIKNEIVEGTPSIKLKDFVSVIRKNTWGDNNNDLVIGFDIEKVDDSTPLTPVSNAPTTTTIVEDKMSKGFRTTAYIGLAVGLGFAYYRKSGFGGYVGYAILGSIIGQVAYNLIKKK